MIAAEEGFVMYVETCVALRAEGFALVGPAAISAIGCARLSVAGFGSVLLVLGKARLSAFPEQFIYILIYYIIFGSQSMQ